MPEQKKVLDVDTGLPKIKAKIDEKQEQLISGTNIKTINNESLLGTGNIDIQAGQGDVKFTGQTGGGNAEIDLRKDNGNYIKLERIYNSGIEKLNLKMRGNNGAMATHDLYTADTVDTKINNKPWGIDVFNNSSTENKTAIHLTSNPVQGQVGSNYAWFTETDNGMKVQASQMQDKELASIDYVDSKTVPQATSDTLGTIKLNPSESVGVNENGQLTVGGRLGQFPDGGLYYPTSADPVAVGNYTLLMSEAKGLSAAHRELIIAGGSTVTLKTTAQAGATQYRISNTQNNRFVCLGWVDGRLAVDEAGAKEKTVAITSVKFANGNNISAYFGATESNNDIIITVAETLNPSGTLSSVRGYGTWKNADVISAGQGNYVGGGKVLQVGQANVSANNKNQIGMIGIRQYCDGASSLLVGADNINKKAFCALFGQGIDNSTGPEGLAAFGKWPVISADTAFVIGNGTAYNARSNLFEIKTNGDIYVNGVRQ